MAAEVDTTTTIEREPVADTGGSLADHEAEFHDAKRTRVVPAASDGDAAAPVVRERKPVAVKSGTDGGDADGQSDEPTAEELAANPNLRYEKRPRHRAKSQQARAEDVPRIKELTKRNKELEERLNALQAQQTTPAKVETPKPAEPLKPVTTDAKFTEPEPTLEQFSNEADPYSAWILAKSDWRHAKRQFEADQRKAAESQQQRQAAEQAEWATLQQNYATKAAAFAQAKPDYQAKLDATLKAFGGDIHLPPASYRAILQADNGSALLYHLFDHHDQLAEMIALWDGKPATQQNVALATRWLSTRAEAGSTGAALPPTSSRSTPKPPTPVRTGAMTTGAEPPGDGASLADHEAFFHARKRR